ncbi:unnamed protein product [Paramecium primaurelia]|uniref:Uncharacterized protein n=1 Tax=Paramecium primaurelia TaxID=5886 RepID=A0A8S1KGA2_PARPR|nr:unnamed protein product [Paramecium primaurelia]
MIQSEIQFAIEIEKFKVFTSKGRLLQNPVEIGQFVGAVSYLKLNSFRWPYTFKIQIHRHPISIHEWVRPETFSRQMHAIQIDVACKRSCTGDKICGLQS